MIIYEANEIIRNGKQCIGYFKDKSNAIEHIYKCCIERLLDMKVEKIIYLTKSDNFDAYDNDWYYKVYDIMLEVASAIHNLYTEDKIDSFYECNAYDTDNAELSLTKVLENWKIK